MKLFSNKSTLRGRLIIVIMLCCSLALLLNTGFIFGVNTVDFKKNKVIRLFMLADVLANNSTAALKFSDKKTAQEILRSAVADVSIKHVALLDDQCQLFEEYSNIIDKDIERPEMATACDGRRNSFYSEDYLYLSVPVMLEEERIGTLNIKSDLKDLIKIVNGQIQVLSLLFFLTLLIAFLLTFKLQMIFLRPITDLLSAIRHITEHKDYSVQVRSRTNDELAILADEFNAMIAKINQHDKLLSNQNQLLEKTVDQRTHELQENLFQLEKAKEIAEVASQAKSAFLSHMSHDLRTPLNSLLGYVQVMLRKKDFPAKYRNELEIIGNCSRYLLSLINDLLDLTKIESGKLELRNNVFNTREFLASIANIFSEQAQKKKLDFIFNIEADLPLSIVGDENRLRRILSNLLENAFKFTEQGSITFTVSYKEGAIAFSIFDTGCGIKEKNLKAIFEPFNQFSRKLDNDGVGLGLYITQYLVELMQGRLVINSRVAEGTHCALTIPLAAEQALSAVMVDKYDEVIGYQGDLKTVLVVDDKSYNRDVLSAMLEPLGFKVICVNSGLACLEQLQKSLIDIVLLDMVMPVLTGIETCQRIYQLRLSDQPKIIMITANAFAEDHENSMLAGCDDFLAKPVILNQLLKIFEKQLALQWIYQSESEVGEQNVAVVSPLRVMVAEDDEICRWLMAQNLQDAGFEAAFAEDGNQAVQMIDKSKFDCIILDYKMPYKTGIEVADYLRQQENPNKQSYIVLMTAMTNDEVHADAMRAGFNEVIAKPIEFDGLIKLMDVAYQHVLSVSQAVN